MGLPGPEPATTADGDDEEGAKFVIVIALADMPPSFTVSLFLPRDEFVVAIRVADGLCRERGWMKVAKDSGRDLVVVKESWL